MRYENIDPNGSAPRYCEAIKLQRSMRVLVNPLYPDVWEEGKPGDYFVAFDDGIQGICTAETFPLVYRPYVPTAINIPIDVHISAETRDGRTIANAVRLELLRMQRQGVNLGFH